MNAKPFDPRKPVQTRDGGSARIICTDRADADYPIVALLEDEQCAMTFTKTGQAWAGSESPCDLINIPERRELWVNVYSTGWGGAHPTRTEADAGAFRDRIACVRVEYTNGEGLEP